MSAQKNKKLVIKPEWCKGCGICVSFCPKNVLVLNDKDKIEIKNIDDCTKCGLCELRCPDYAIYIKEDE